MTRFHEDLDLYEDLKSIKEMPIFSFEDTVGNMTSLIKVKTYLEKA